MSSFLLDDTTGDLKIVNNKFVLTTGLQAIKQHVKNRFEINLGEWFLDTDIGVPYYRDIFIKNPSFATVEGILKAVILQTPGVLVLEDFNFDYDNKTRRASLKWKALAQDGPINFSQLVVIPIG